MHRDIRSLLRRPILMVPDISTDHAERAENVWRTASTGEPLFPLRRVTFAGSQLILVREGFAVVRHRRQDCVVQTELHHICVFAVEIELVRTGQYGPQYYSEVSTRTFISLSANIITPILAQVSA